MNIDNDLLQALVERFKVECRPGILKWMDYFRSLRHLEVAILDAVILDPITGARHQHHRQSGALLEKFEHKLQRNKEELRAASSFEALHRIIAREAEFGIGKLAIYDAATRIGAYLNLHPDLVYLHQGAAEGARALGFKGATIDPKDLPRVLSEALTPEEIEDFLCCYKAELAGKQKASGGCGRRKAA